MLVSYEFYSWYHHLFDRIIILIYDDCFVNLLCPLTLTDLHCFIMIMVLHSCPYIKFKLFDIKILNKSLLSILLLIIAEKTRFI